MKNTFQVGVGANLSPLKGSEAHTVIAAGWTPRVGTIYTPIHFFFIPDVDGVHRTVRDHGRHVLTGPVTRSDAKFCSPRVSCTFAAWFTRATKSRTCSTRASS